MDKEARQSTRYNNLTKDRNRKFDNDTLRRPKNEPYRRPGKIDPKNINIDDMDEFSEYEDDF